MSIRLNTIIFILALSFVAKISVETATAKREPERKILRSAASIDQSYADHMNLK